MKKLIIHIGYPKTATTTLQLNIFADLYKKGKIEYLNHLNNDTNGYLGNYYIKNIIQSLFLDKKISKNIVKQELEKLREINKKISLISAETLSVMYPGFNYSNFNSNAKMSAKKMKDFFSPYFDSIHIIIGIREQSMIVRSIYKQWHANIVSENPECSKLSNWLFFNFIKNKDNYDQLPLNYSSMILEYNNVFKEDNVNILIFEDLLKNKTRYMNILSNIFNVDRDYISKCLNKKRRNLSIIDNNGNVKATSSTLGQKITRPFKFLIKKYCNETIYLSMKKIYYILIPIWIREKVINENFFIRNLTIDEKKIMQQIFYPLNKQLILFKNINKFNMKKYGYFQ